MARDAAQAEGQGAQGERRPSSARAAPSVTATNHGSATQPFLQCPPALISELPPSPQEAKEPKSNKKQKKDPKVPVGRARDTLRSILRMEGRG